MLFLPGSPISVFFIVVAADNVARQTVDRGPPTVGGDALGTSNRLVCRRCFLP